MTQAGLRFPKCYPEDVSEKGLFFTCDNAMEIARAPSDRIEQVTMD